MIMMAENGNSSTASFKNLEELCSRLVTKEEHTTSFETRNKPSNLIGGFHFQNSICKLIGGRIGEHFGFSLDCWNRFRYIDRDVCRNRHYFNAISEKEFIQQVHNFLRECRSWIVEWISGFSSSTSGKCFFINHLKFLLVLGIWFSRRI